MFTQTGPAAQDRRRTGPALRGNGQPRVADVDGLLLPAGRQQRPAADHHVPRRRRRQAHDRAPRRLLRPRLDRAPLARDPGPRTVLRKTDGNLRAPRDGDVQRQTPSHGAATPTSSPTAAGRPSIPTSSSTRGRRRAKRKARRTFDGQPHIGHTTRAAALEPSPEPQADAHPRRRPGLRLARRPRRLTAAEAALQHLRADGRFFATMRRNQASPDLAQQYKVPAANHGLERFLTATRRQNFLVPPRRNRAFPLVELT